MNERGDGVSGSVSVLVSACECERVFFLFVYARETKGTGGNDGRNKTCVIEGDDRMPNADVRDEHDLKPG